MALYEVETERFGTITKAADTIAEARRWAREALGVRNPRCTTRAVDYVRCGTCDAAPCVCAPERSP